MYTIFWASLKILEGGLWKEYDRLEDFKICLDVTSLKFDNLTLIRSTLCESRWLIKRSGVLFTKHSEILRSTLPVYFRLHRML